MDYFSAMRLFVRIVELGSFSKAAADRAVKISSVSRAVAGLEADLGVALLNRSTRRLHPTEAGLELFDRAQRILAEVEQTRDHVASLNGRPQGLLKINIPGAFGRRHVIPQLPGFLARYPLVRVEATLTEQTIDLIEAGADLAIRIGALPNSSLVAKKLAPHRRVLCAAPAYLERHPPPADPGALAGHECLRFSLLQPSDRWQFSQNDKKTGVTVDGPLRANDSEALLDAALAGLGIALLPSWIVGNDLKAGRLLRLLPDWQASLAPGDRSVWAVYPPKKVVSPKVRAFLAHIEGCFGHPPYWE